MIAEGIIMSSIMYIIIVYGSCSEYLKDCLQVVQNTAARCVTGLAWTTPVAVLLLQFGWLSVRQLIMFHSLVTVFKIKQDGKPIYLNEKLSRSFNYETRLSKTNAIRKTEKIGSDYRKLSFIPRSSNQWIIPPAKIRNLTELKHFKTELRSWIKKNVSIQ